MLWWWMDMQDLDSSWVHQGRYDGNRNVGSMRKARGAEEATPQELLGVGEGIWSLAPDEEASVVGYLHGGSLADNSPPNRSPAP